jgi:UDP-N-acetylmuramyl pentapeptide phosphotransferase/UDP-N-acetylglucosamine-1-phosphate transferase
MFDTDYNIFFAFLTSLFITYVAIPRVIFFSEKFRLSDVPGERASHKRSIPIFGGIAIFSGIILSLLFWADIAEIQFILVSLVIVFFLGIIDDLLGLTPYKKLFGQAVAILIIIYFGEIKIDSMHGVLGIYKIPDFVAFSFTAFVIVVITNGINLIDGVDGLAGGIAFISSCAFCTVILSFGDYDMAIIAFSLMGSLLAFLKYNFPPAKLFMGDTGSLLIGMILSVLAIRLIGEGLVTETFHLPNKGPLLAIAFLAIPLFDSLRVFIVRIRKGRHPLYPGRGHIHHALLDLGIGHKKTALFLYLVSILLIAGSFFLINLNINIGIAILAAFSYLILITPFYLPRKRKK